MSELKRRRRELEAQIKRLRLQQRSSDVAQEIATTAELIREINSKLLIEKATRWGIEVPDKPEWRAVTIQNRSGGAPYLLALPYLNETGRAILNHRIRTVGILEVSRGNSHSNFLACCCGALTYCCRLGSVSKTVKRGESRANAVSVADALIMGEMKMQKWEYQTLTDVGLDDRGNCAYRINGELKDAASGMTVYRCLE